MTTIFHKSLAKTDNDFPRRGLTFVAATACLVCTFIAAAIAIPMMAEWRSGLSLSESEMAMTVVSYFAGCVLTLFFLCTPFELLRPQAGGSRCTFARHGGKPHVRQCT